MRIDFNSKDGVRHQSRKQKRKKPSLKNVAAAICNLIIDFLTVKSKK